MGPKLMQHQEPRPQAKSAGDLEELIEIHQESLVRYAYRIVGDMETARDVTQETFLKYIEKPLRFGEPRQWASWLFRVTHNRCIDILKKESRRRELRLQMASPREVSTPGESAQSIEQRAMLDAMMKELSENQRAVLTLFYQEGMSYKEIAAVTGLSMSNVGMTLQRGLAKMRTIAPSDAKGQL